MNLGVGGCSEPRLHHYTPAWATELGSLTTTARKSRRLLCRDGGESIPDRGASTVKDTEEGESIVNLQNGKCGREDLLTGGQRSERVRY